MTSLRKGNHGVKFASRKRKAGHRSWGRFNAPVPGTHRGDIMSREKRSMLMSRIQGKNTKPELRVFEELRRKGIDFSKHAAGLPGTPDVVIRQLRLAVFVDGDFWHGWRYPLWKHKLSPSWQKKIENTRQRDQRNFSELRHLGWVVVRIWEHQVESNIERCILRVTKTIDTLRTRNASATLKEPPPSGSVARIPRLPGKREDKQHFPGA